MYNVCTSTIWLWKLRLDCFNEMCFRFDNPFHRCTDSESRTASHDSMGNICNEIKIALTCISLIWTISYNRRYFPPCYYIWINFLNNFNSGTYWKQMEHNYVIFHLLWPVSICMMHHIVFRRFWIRYKLQSNQFLYSENTLQQTFGIVVHYGLPGATMKGFVIVNI